MNKDFLQEDTIVALATPMGCSAIAVIRLSGKNSIKIVNSIVKNLDLNTKKTHTLTFTEIFDNDNFLDEVLIAVFLGEKSFTKEDSVEISCHGSPYIINKIISLILSKGARLAQPGEFTQRAFLNGRFDLVQAEAIADIIHSQDEKMHKMAASQFKGGFVNDLKNLREQLKTLAALLELELDFSEEDVSFANRDELKNILIELNRKALDLINSYQTGRAIKEGVSIAIVGKPNVGKSTLLNALLNYDRAITSSIPGTTRDTLEEVIYLSGIKCRIIDTAGIRSTLDEIEKMGIERSLRASQLADIVVYVADITNFNLTLINDDLSRLACDFAGKLIKIANKSDLINDKMIFKKVYDNDFIPLSGMNDSDVKKIENKIGEVLSSIDNSGAIINNMRHFECITKCYESTQKALRNLQSNMPTELIMQEVKYTLVYIGELTGEICSDDILDIIFSKFCIGK